MQELRAAVDKAYAAHLAAIKAVDLPPDVKADRIAETRIALQEAQHKARFKHLYEPTK